MEQPYGAGRKAVVGLSDDADMIISFSEKDCQFSYDSYDAAPTQSKLNDDTVAVKACPVETVPMKKVKFITDTGCAHDLVSRSTASRAGMIVEPGEGGVNFMTANGVTGSCDKATYNSSSPRLSDAP